MGGKALPKSFNRKKENLHYILLSGGCNPKKKFTNDDGTAWHCHTAQEINEPLFPRAAIATFAIITIANTALATVATTATVRAATGGFLATLAAFAVIAIAISAFATITATATVALIAIGHGLSGGTGFHFSRTAGFCFGGTAGAF